MKEEQHSLEWFRKRLGNFTGSQVGLLMKKGRSDYFSDTAKSYIYQVAAERSMNPAIVEDNDLFNDYLCKVSISSKSMQWGNEQEANARELYSKITGFDITEVGSCKHPTIEHFASSPDGIFEVGGRIIGCIEIKCPNQNTYMKYRSEISDNKSLLSVKYEYYYQCMAHMMCLGAEWCDFVVYNPFQLSPIGITRIVADESVFREIEERVVKANQIVKDLINM